MTKWLSNRIHRTNWNQCTAGYGSLKVDPNSQVRFCTSPHRSLQLSSPMDLSFVIRPKGDVFLSFTTLYVKRTVFRHQCCLQFYTFTVYTTQSLICIGVVLIGVHAFPLTNESNFYSIIRVANHPKPDNNPPTPSPPDNIETPIKSCDLQSISECTYPSTLSTNPPNNPSINIDSSTNDASTTCSLDCIKSKARLFTKFLAKVQPA